MTYLRPYGDSKEDTEIINLLGCIGQYPGNKIFDTWRTTLFNRGNLYTGVQNYVYLHKKRSENVWVLNVFSQLRQTALRLRFYNCDANCTVRLHVAVTVDNDNDNDNLFLAINIKTFIEGLILKFLEGQPVTILYVKDYVLLKCNLYSSDFVKNIKQLCDEL